ncbi:MAG: DUF1549 and DUF1553 domain-containing protein [Gemmataceae bacterium]
MPAAFWMLLVCTAPAPTKLHVFPSAVDLSDLRDRQAIIVQAEYPDGSLREVSAEATYSLDEPIAKIAQAELAPLADGSTTLRIAFAGLKASVPVKVHRSGEAEPLRFRNDVMAVFSRVGCNSGKCHGAASGKDGFRLSLFGYDPEGDYRRITREAGGRRVNLAFPDESLLLNKALGKVPHTGGARVQEGSENHQILKHWLETGAKKDPPELAKPLRIEVFPKEAIFARKGGTQRVVVRAHYSDGTDRDVTRFSVFIGNNDAAARVSEDGLIEATGPGEAFILARFDQFTEGVSVLVRPGTPFTAPKVPAYNYIDTLVQKKLDKLHIIPSEVCSDEVFVRRVYIDLIGLVPTPEERAAFLADRHPKKREKLVDALLETKDFRDMWVMKWAELLQIRTINGISPKALKLYDGWLRDRIRSGATIDQVLGEVLPAIGGTFENPAANYYQTETDPNLLAENIAQVFLGTRIQCAQCHNHPFDRWTMDDYYGFAAFFAQVGFKNAADPRELTVYNSETGGVKHPVDDRDVPPQFLGGERPKLKKGEDRRAVLAKWLVSTENAAFARNLANITWAQFFGKGIVDPVDDMRVSNPPSNPELLDELGRRLAGYRYDIKKLVRDIVLSRTYQLSTTKNASNALDERNFARQTVRRMRAEVLLDSINRITEVEERHAGVPAGGRAIEIPDGVTRNYFLMTFGRASRRTACACEVKTNPTLSQALHLLNGETTNAKIIEGRVVEKLLNKGPTPIGVAEQLYVRTLGRNPTPSERAKIAARLEASSDKKEALEDLFWALLNTNEFLFNR